MQKENELKMIFALFANKQNIIPEDSVSKALSCARCVFKKTDLDVGAIDYETFERLVIHYREKGITREEVEACFKRFDAEETGYITAVQLKSLLLSGNNSMSQSDAQYLLEQSGVDDRGMICYKLLIEQLFAGL